MHGLRRRAANVLALDGSARPQAAAERGAELMGTRRDPERWQLPPARLGECRKGGIDISMSCPLCGHAWMLPIGDATGDDAMPVSALVTMAACECVRKGGPRASPEHRPWVRWLEDRADTTAALHDRVRRERLNCHALSLPLS